MKKIPTSEKAKCYCKHLRPYLKRMANKATRKIGKREARREQPSRM